MKNINLSHKSYNTAKKEMEKHGDDCVLDSMKGVYFIICKCDEKKVLSKKSKKDILKEIDADGNGHITRKEVMDWSNK